MNSRAMGMIDFELVPIEGKECKRLKKVVQIRDPASILIT